MELRITVTFADRRFHGRIREDELEFPPSPLRLFQALVAASHRGAYGLVNQEARDRALNWLSSLAPPTIEAGTPVESGIGMTNYVPNNDNLPNHVRTAKPMLRHVLTADATVVFRWEFSASDDARAQARVVCAMAQLLTHLGQHQDIVYAHGEISEGISEPVPGRVVHRPFPVSNGGWQIPQPGALDALRDRYAGVLAGESPFNYDIPSRPVAYRPDDVISVDVPTVVFALKEKDGKSARFEPYRLREVAGMVRNAAMEWQKRNEGMRRHYGEAFTSRLVAGHEPNGAPYDGAHFAFVPLPSLNEKSTADGWIRRVLVIGYGCDTREAHELFRQLINGLNGMVLSDEGGKTRNIRLERIDQDTILPLFVGKKPSCRVWRSVTPVVFTGMTRKGRPQSALVARALVQAGFKADDIESIGTFNGPIVPKTLRPYDYNINKDSYLAKVPRVHTEVWFKRPVVGPLVIGRGRHCGFGLMLPVSETAPTDYLVLNE